MAMPPPSAHAPPPTTLLSLPRELQLEVTLQALVDHRLSRASAQADVEVHIRATLGYICSALAGVFGSTQYALVQIGKRESHSKHGVFDERFYPLGSWLALFGVSAVVLDEASGRERAATEVFNKVDADGDGVRPPPSEP